MASEAKADTESLGSDSTLGGDGTFLLQKVIAGEIGPQMTDDEIETLVREAILVTLPAEYRRAAERWLDRRLAIVGAAANLGLVTVDDLD